ncbi:hypothetical protein KI387_011273, partial [Taxus chinensis]
AIQYYLSHTPDRTPDGQLLMGMPISIAAHLAPTPPDKQYLTSCITSPVSQSDSFRGSYDPRLAFPLVNLGPH